MLEETRTLSRATPEEFEHGEWRLADLSRPFGRGMNLEIDVEDIEAAESRIRNRGYPMLLDLHERTHRVGDRKLKVADYWLLTRMATSAVSRREWRRSISVRSARQAKTRPVGGRSGREFDLD